MDRCEGELEPGGTLTGCITCTLLYGDGTGDGWLERLMGDAGWDERETKTWGFNDCNNCSVGEQVWAWSSIGRYTAR